MEFTQELIKTVGILLDVSSRKNIIFDDHSYVLEDKTYIPGNYISIPTQFLFLDSFTKIYKLNDTEIDIVTVNDNINQKINPNVLEEKFNSAIQESQIINRDGDYEYDWQSNVIKFTWSHKQIMIYDRSISILINYQQAKLIYSNGTFHPIKRKVYLEKSANLFRNLLILFDWEIELIKWLHYNLVSLLPISLLIAYTEILCLLKAKIPWVVLEMTESAFSPSTDLSASLNQGMNNGIMHKQIKDNFITISSLIHNLVLSSSTNCPKAIGYNQMPKPQSSKNKTIVLIVAPLPFDDISKTTDKLGSRFNRWINAFMMQDSGWHVEVLSVEGVGNENVGGNGSKFDEEREGGAGGEQEISPLQFVRSVFAALRTKIMKLKSQNPTSTVIVWGWSIASLMACYASLQTTVDAVVCLGFPFVDLKEKRLTSLGNEMGGGQLENNLVLLQKLTCPVVYVIGAISRINSIKFVEQLRYRQKSAPSALIVVGHVNDELCLLEDCLWITDSNDRTTEVHLNQELADALIFRAIHQKLAQLLASSRTQCAPSLTTLTTSTALSATASLNNLKTHKRPAQNTKLKSKVPRASKTSKLGSDTKALAAKGSGLLQTQHSSFPIMSAQVSPGKPLLKKLFTD